MLIEVVRHGPLSLFHTRALAFQKCWLVWTYWQCLNTCSLSNNCSDKLDMFNVHYLACSQLADQCMVGICECLIFLSGFTTFYTFCVCVCVCLGFSIGEGSWRLEEGVTPDIGTCDWCTSLKVKKILHCSAWSQLKLRLWNKDEH